MKERLKKLTDGIAAVFLAIRDTFKALTSPDWPTRRMAILFFVSILMVVIMGTAIFWRLRHVSEIRERQRLAQMEIERLHKEEEERKNEEIKLKTSQISLGIFKLELKLEAGEKTPPGIENQAEVEITVFCDSPETKAFVEENLLKVRNEVVTAMTGVYKNQLLSKEGKRVLKKQLIERLNHFLTDGKVKEVYFSNLLVT